MVDGLGNSVDIKIFYGVIYDYGILLNLVCLLCFFFFLMDLLFKIYMYMDWWVVVVIVFDVDIGDGLLMWKLFYNVGGKFVVGDG